MGIRILPPDVNRSGLKFTPEMTPDVPGLPDPSAFSLQPSAFPSIRYGLAAIKNVGEAAMEAAIEERRRHGLFKSLEDFCSRLDSRKVNKKVVESLVKCGAFDWTGIERAALAAEIDSTLAASASSQRDKASGQAALFDTFAAAPPPRRSAIAIPPWPKAEKLGFEKELLGFYVTGHPLDEYRGELESGKYTPINALAEAEDKATVQLGGALTGVEKKFTKKESKPFAIVVLEDLTGSVEVMVWNETFAKSGPLLEMGKVVAMTARVDKREESLRLAASEIRLLPVSVNGAAPGKISAPGNGPARGKNGAASGGNEAAPFTPVLLRFQHPRTTELQLIELKEALARHPGPRPVHVEFVNGQGCKLLMKLGAQYGIDLCPELQSRLGEWLVSN
jgi:DNA polymerase-3 subunit alpha